MQTGVLIAIVVFLLFLLVGGGVGIYFAVTAKTGGKTGKDGIVTAPSTPEELDVTFSL